MSTSTFERFRIEVKTPVGSVSVSAEAPTSFVPITAIVPLMRRVGEEAQSLEQQHAKAAGGQVSCRMGCAACCRMLVPVSPPEAFALKELVEELPAPRRERIIAALAAARARLEEAGLLARLKAVADPGQPLADEELDPLNQDYYALRMPCPFLDNELCSIYEGRPAACRELLVTSPAELCDDMVNNPVRPLPPPLRISTVLGLLWSELEGGAPRLIPLPIALEWAEHHAAAAHRVWKGSQLLERALEKAEQFLDQASANRQERSQI